VETDIQALRMRITNVEEGLAGLNRRLDRTDRPLLTIEKASGSWTRRHPALEEWLAAHHMLGIDAFRR
jgi:hypothetical protein